MRTHFPDGKYLPALERNILKFRAFQMALILFHTENLKSFVLGSIRATDRLKKTYSGGVERLPEGTKKVYEKAWQILVDDGIITKDQCDDIQSIINYRNDIAHRMYQLTCDIKCDEIVDSFAKYHSTKYDYTALDRLARYKKKIIHAIKKKYVVVLSYDDYLFNSADQAYRDELRGLEAKIDKQFKERERKCKRINQEVNNLSQSEWHKIFPEYSLNKQGSGKLTKRGIACCLRLFDNGLSPEAVAYVMRVSNICAKRWYCRWQSGYETPEIVW